VAKVIVPSLCPTNPLSVYYSTRHLHIAILSPSSHTLDRLAQMTILEVFELLFTELRFENPITTPTKRLKAEVIGEDEVISEKRDEKVCYSSHGYTSFTFFGFSANPILGRIGKRARHDLRNWHAATQRMNMVMYVRLFPLHLLSLPKIYLRLSQFHKVTSYPYPF